MDTQLAPSNDPELSELKARDSPASKSRAVTKVSSSDETECQTVREEPLPWLIRHVDNRDLTSKR